MAEDLIVSAGAVAGVVLADGRHAARAERRARDRNVPGRQDLPRRRSPRRGPLRRGAGARARPAALARLGFPLGRLKTGTPPRIDRASVDLGDDGGTAAERRPAATSATTRPRGFAGPQLSCWVTVTNDNTHRIVRENLHRSPLYGLDLIRGIGPRYCPSIEDKVVKFAHNPTHQIFIEPEGWDEPTLYVGGFSTSLPAEVQLAMLRTLAGPRAGVRMLRPGYAVEYDFVPPTELDREPRDAPRRGPLPLRAAQRDLGLRGGGRARPGRRNQRGAPRRRGRAAAAGPRDARTSAC